jgi:large subunit ribosomal protein L29
MKTAEIRNLSDMELGRRLDEAHQEMFNLRFQYATGQLKNTARLGEVRARLPRCVRTYASASWRPITRRAERCRNSESA